MPTHNFKVGEMLNKRTPNSKTWINFDGSYTTEIYSGVIHYDDEEGNLHNINTDLYDEADLDLVDEPIAREGRERFREVKEKAREDKRKGRLNRDLFDYQGLKVPFDAKIPRNFKRGYIVGRGQNKLKFRPIGASPSKGYVDEGRKNLIHYQDAWNDTDVTLELTTTGVKETIILKTDRAPASFSFEVDGPLEDDLTSGELKLQPAWLQDANGEKRDVSQTIRREGEQTFIDLVADVSGLVYPIEIDPTVAIQPNTTAGKDSYIASGAVNSNYGTDAYTVVGKDGSSAYRSLIQFDISAIPISADISSANMELWFYDTNNTAPTNCYIHEITGAWTEMGVTWNNQPTFNPTAVLSVQLSGLSGVARTFNILSLVKDWVAGNKTNNGLLIKTDELNAIYHVYASSDNTTASLRPKLFITYNVPPTAPTVISPNGGETWNSLHTIAWDASNDLNYDEATVVNLAYDMSGNGGRKLVRLSNGWFVMAARDAIGGKTYFYVSKDNFATIPIQLCYLSFSAVDYSLVAVGTTVYCLATASSSNAANLYKFDAVTVTNTIIAGQNVDSQSAIGNCSLAINEQGTELHAAWVSKNPMYSYSWNIRYCKGTINQDGSVSWGTVTQVTKMDSTAYPNAFLSPSIVVNGSKVVILCQSEGLLPQSSQSTDFMLDANARYILAFINDKTGLLNDGIGYDSNWSFSPVYGVTGTAYAQSSPSAIFVPQNINGLPNGRIWVTWHGRDAMENFDHIRVSYSDNGGATWSSMQKLTSGTTAGTQHNQPSITANNNNEVFIVWWGRNSTSEPQNVRKIKYNGTWGSVTSVTNNMATNALYPSTLFDLSINFAEPSFIYQDNEPARVGFYGYIGTPATNLQYQIQLSTNNGGAWKDIVSLTAVGATSHQYDFINEPETSMAKIRIRAYDGSAYGPWDESDGVFTIIHNQAPNAPTNLSPSGNAIDRTAIARLSWTHNDPNGTDPQSKFDLDWRLQSQPSWNTVTQITTNQYWDVPASTFPYGTIEWRVRTYDQAGLVGPYSAVQTFIASDKPATPTITSPTNGSTVAIANPVVQWSSFDQAGYHLKVLSSGGSLLWEDIATSTNKARTIGYQLTNNTNYIIQLAIRNADGLYSNFASVDINVSYTPPNEPIVTVTSDNDRGSITLNVDNPAISGTAPMVVSMDVYKNINGVFTRIATGLPASSGNISTFIDYTVRHGQAEQYFVRVHGDNNTFTDSDIVTGSAIFQSAQLALTADYSKWVKLKYGASRTKRRNIERVISQFAGRPYAMAEYGEHDTWDADISVIITNESDLDMLDYLVESRSTLLYRDNHGKREYVTLDGYEIEDHHAGFWTVSLTIDRVYFVEEV